MKNVHSKTNTTEDISERFLKFIDDIEQEYDTIDYQNFKSEYESINFILNLLQMHLKQIKTIVNISSEKRETLMTRFDQTISKLKQKEARLSQFIFDRHKQVENIMPLIVDDLAILINHYGAQSVEDKQFIAKSYMQELSKMIMQCLTLENINKSNVYEKSKGKKAKQ